MLAGELYDAGDPELAITIGDRVQIGPAVQLLAADHPRDVPAGVVAAGNPCRVIRAL